MPGLSWAWYLLARILGRSKNCRRSGPRARRARAQSLGFALLDMWPKRVIKESMPALPPAWAVGSQAIRDFETRGYQIPVGANLVMSQWVCHRMQDSSRTRTVRPSRWRNRSMSEIPKFAYFPFGGRPGSAVGASFCDDGSHSPGWPRSREISGAAVAGDRSNPWPSFTLASKHGIRVALMESPGELADPLRRRHNGSQHRPYGNDHRD